uniref:Protein kinase domain-containing protein n=1 Tax=Macrostomum lignano TaxID=282301 RepID=A0A1I8F7N7_9PLAT
VLLLLLTKRKLSNNSNNDGVGSAQHQPAAAAPPPAAEGDYHITVGEELKSTSHAYRVLSYLGRGTFGQVGGIEAEILQRLCREDTDACNIVRALECFVHRSHLCLAFELLDQNLYDYLKAQKFRPLMLKEIRPIAQQPENIMLVHPGEDSWRRLSREAVTSTYLQSRYYRAPEILLGLPFNESIDMWSLGCVLAELYMGWPLYPGSSEYDQTACFFNRHPYSYAYQLKPANQYLAETGIRSKEVRKYRLSSLDQLALDPWQLSTSSSSASSAERVPDGSAETDLERSDRLQFCSLVKRLLRLESKTRIEPDNALVQPFITMLRTCSLMRVCHQHLYRSGQQQPPPPPQLTPTSAEHSASSLPTQPPPQLHHQPVSAACLPPALHQVSLGIISSSLSLTSRACSSLRLCFISSNRLHCSISRVASITQLRFISSFHQQTQQQPQPPAPPPPPLSPTVAT